MNRFSIGEYEYRTVYLHLYEEDFDNQFDDSLEEMWEQLCKFMREHNSDVEKWNLYVYHSTEYMEHYDDANNMLHDISCIISSPANETFSYAYFASENGPSFFYNFVEYMIRGEDANGEKREISTVLDTIEISWRPKNSDLMGTHQQSQILEAFKQNHHIKNIIVQAGIHHSDLQDFEDRLASIKREKYEKKIISKKKIMLITTIVSPLFDHCDSETDFVARLQRLLY